MNAADRDSQISTILDNHFELAKSIIDITVNPADTAELENIFSTTAWGYREIILVIIIGRMLNDKYSASSAFYSTNPRPMYEGPIRRQLQANHIPHRKSGPLNVAKAAIGINEQWAAQRRPREVAQDVVVLVKKIDEYNSDQLSQLLTALLRRFLMEADRIDSLMIEVSPESDPQFLSDIATDLITKVPDGGNTPQKIVGILMQAYHDDLQSGIVIHGYEDSASVTNTTSKKPGDITEELLDGTVIKVYEITVKKFDEARIIESYQSIKAYSNSHQSPITEVIVICRKQDAVELTDKGASLYFGKYQYQDMTYHFMDIDSWITAQLLRMSTDARLAYYESLSTYINESNTSEAVKLRWIELHTSN